MCQGNHPIHPIFSRTLLSPLCQKAVLSYTSLPYYANTDLTLFSRPLLSPAHPHPIGPKPFESHLFLVLAHNPQHEVHDHGRKQGNREDRGAKAIVKAALATLPYALSAPVEGDEGVGHSGHGNEGEEAGGDLADLVAKVQQADGEAAQDDGEVQPREEGALVGEEDLGLDARGECDAFACACQKLQLVCYCRACVPGAV
jgi:hypothetical protein